MGTDVVRRTERYPDDQIVVAQPHLPYLAHVLDQLGVRYTVTDTLAELDLVLLTLDGMAAAVAPLGPERAQAAKARYPEVEPADVADLDVLMYKVRAVLRDAYDGWVPEMGKNRHVEGVQGFPHISGGAESEPRPVDEAFELPAAGSAVGQGVRVGVLDTRLLAHPVLVGRYSVEAGSLLLPAEPAEELSGHGTFVAGLILHRAPGAWLDVRHVLDDERAASTSWAVARAMMRFAESGVHVLNLSLGCFTDDRQPPLVLQRAVERLGRRFVIVAAAGNHGDPDEAHPDEDADAPDWLRDRPRPGPRTPIWPAALDGVVAVGATGPGHDPAPFSPQVPWVDLVAPGVDVASAYLFGRVHIRRHSHHDGQTELHEREVAFKTGHARWSGTSFAAANVTGQIAARVRPGRLEAHEVVQQLLRLPPGQADADVMAYRV